MHLTVFSSLSLIISDFEQLRALELNSWQLLRLMQAQIQSSSFPGFSCNCFLDGTCEGLELDISECSGDKEKQLICLFRNAAVLHGIWKSKKSTECVSYMRFSLTVLLLTLNSLYLTPRMAFMLVGRLVPWKISAEL